MDSAKEFSLIAFIEHLSPQFSEYNNTNIISLVFSKKKSIANFQLCFISSWIIRPLNIERKP